MVLSVLGFFLDMGPFVYRFLVDVFHKLTNGVRYSGYLLEDLIHDHISDVDQNFE